MHLICSILFAGTRGLERAPVLSIKRNKAHALQKGLAMVAVYL